MPLLFSGQDYEKQGPGTSDQSLFSYKSSERLLYYVSTLTKFDDVI